MTLQDLPLSVDTCLLLALCENSSIGVQDQNLFKTFETKDSFVFRSMYSIVYRILNQMH